jgi:hypothetical protein
LFTSLLDIKNLKQNFNYDWNNLITDVQTLAKADEGGDEEPYDEENIKYAISISKKEHSQRRSSRQTHVTSNLKTLSRILAYLVFIRVK